MTIAKVKTISQAEYPSSTGYRFDDHQNFVSMSSVFRVYEGSQKRKATSLETFCVAFKLLDTIAHLPCVGFAVN